MTETVSHSQSTCHDVSQLVDDGGDAHRRGEAGGTDRGGLAGAQRGQLHRPLGGDDGLLGVAAVAGGADLVAVDLAARAGVEGERAAGGVVAEQRRLRAPEHVDAAIGAGIDEIEARERAA